ncbi:hypothetical protein V8F33_003088 [Rhypophila sp. PSN 637]
MDHINGLTHLRSTICTSGYIGLEYRVPFLNSHRSLFPTCALEFQLSFDRSPLTELSPRSTDSYRMCDNQGHVPCTSAMRTRQKAFSFPHDRTPRSRMRQWPSCWPIPQRSPIIQGHTRSDKRKETLLGTIKQAFSADIPTAGYGIILVIFRAKITKTFYPCPLPAVISPINLTTFPQCRGNPEHNRQNFPSSRRLVCPTAVSRISLVPTARQGIILVLAALPKGKHANGFLLTSQPPPLLSLGQRNKYAKMMACFGRAFRQSSPCVKCT